MYSVFGSFWYNVINKRKDIYANQLLTVNCIFFQEEERRKITLLESKVDELQLRLTEANQKLVCILFFMIHYTDASVEGFFWWVTCTILFLFTYSMVGHGRDSFGLC